MRPRWIEIAAAGLVVFASSGAVAQDTGAIGQGAIAQPPAQLGSPQVGTGQQPSGALLSLPEPFTPQNVSSERPFGNIDVSRAGTTTAQVRTWAQTRTPMERNELSGRCDVIVDPANSARYPANAQEFCRTYIAMSQITPPALKSPLKY